MTEQPRHLAPAPRVRAGHAIVIGGGASGTLMAAHLLRADPGTRVTLVEARGTTGQGVAYSTRDPDHLLNTRAHNMSAFPDDPGHFLAWAQGCPGGDGVTGLCFVSRATYGRYLAGLLDPWRDGPRLAIVQDSAVRLAEDARGVCVMLQGGAEVAGDVALLATGHVHDPDDSGLVHGAWDDGIPADREGRVIIAGSGLSMVDRVISLRKAGHRGEILALSRRGLLPLPHAASRPWPVTAAEIPLGRPPAEIMRWLRGLAAQATAAGGTWRDAVDGVRPHVQALWQAMPTPHRARFLRHAATLWDIHRHRVAPASEQVLRAALAEGQLRLMRGHFRGALRRADGSLVARVTPHGQGAEVLLPAVRIDDCRGIRRDPGRHAGPLVADLLARGRVRIDPLRIGLDTDAEGRPRDAQGLAVPRLFAIGPVARAALWEITAIPDIRDQTARLAARLAVV